jgi:hypothetical protein
MEQIINKPTRHRRNRAAILELLDKFKESQLSIKEFCLLHQISQASFHKWQSRYRNKAFGKPAPGGFADLHVTASAHRLFAEVKGIKIYQPVAAAYLKELLQ